MPIPPLSFSSNCPFCAIATAYPPSSSPVLRAPSTPSPQAYVLLSTPLLLAFLDHAPISRGHVLLATRQHREKLGDVNIDEGQALGAWLGVLSRAVVKVALKRQRDTRTGVGRGEVCEEDEDVGDWNIVQNNGARAAQVVPHVHFHIIPRPEDVPQIENRSWTIFGRGQREDLDEEDAVVLLEEMRAQIQVEIERVRNASGERALEVLMGDGRESRRKSSGEKL